MEFVVPHGEVISVKVPSMATQFVIVNASKWKCAGCCTHCEKR